MIEILSFTGVDTRTDPEAAVSLWSRYPLVELGVLVGSHSGEPGRNRYPPLALVEQWRDLSSALGNPMALHLCGRYARSVTSGPIDTVLELSEGFHRVQVNATSYDYDRVAEFAEAVASDSVILQRHYRPQADPPLIHPKVEYLQDLSGGRGRSDFAAWPEPASPARRWGYAGGLGPRNIDRAVEFAARFGSFRLWLDMESRVRTSDDWMSLEAVAAVCDAVCPADV